jgi:hypothetical protein
MGKRIKTVKQEEVMRLAEDLASLCESIDQVLARHHELGQTRWLGGDRDANNYEVAPLEIVAAREELRSSRRMLNNHACAVLLLGLKDDKQSDLAS